MTEAEGASRAVLGGSTPIADRADMLALSGNFEQAVALYRAALNDRPDHPAILRKLAGALQSAGASEEAAECYRRAIALDPSDARSHEEFGRLLGALGDMRNAAEVLRAALRLDPNAVSARVLLGDALCRQGLAGEGISELEIARTIDPNNWALSLRLGIALAGVATPRLDEAIECFRRVIALYPGHASAHVELGLALHKRGDVVSAVALLERAARLDPKLASAYDALGSVLFESGRYDEAIPSLQTALAAIPNHANILFRLGTSLCRASGGRARDGMTCLRRAIDLEPRNLEAHIQLCSALAQQGYRDRARAAYRAALALFPDNPTLRLGATVAELPIVCESEAELEASRETYASMLDSLSRFFAERKDHAVENARAIGTAQPLYVAYQGRNDRELQGRYGAIVSSVMSAAYPQWAEPPEVPPPSPGEPIRIGVASGHFYGHSVLKVPIWGWAALFDRRRFRLIGYHTASYQDGETARVRRAFDRFTQGPFSLEEWCRRIRADAPHVLIFPEIGMDPMVPKLAGLRLAPIQCAGQGHPVTSGFPTVDYYLSSELMEPGDAELHYTERVVRLPNLGVAYIPPPVAPSSPRREALGVRAEATVYLCCQYLPKYLPQFDHVFVDIARKVGNAQFVFIGSMLGSEVTARFQRRLKRVFADQGLDASRHVVVLSPLATADFMGVAAVSDVFLDSIGWSGYNSTLECLALSLPIVTWPGSFMRGRHSYAILKMMGVTETVASTLENYVEIAVRLAKDPIWRSAVRDRIRDRRSAVYADATPARALEAWLEEIVRR